jgi:hypothetical protein
LPCNAWKRAGRTGEKEARKKIGKVKENSKKEHQQLLMRQLGQRGRKMLAKVLKKLDNLVVRIALDGTNEERQGNWTM